MSKIQHVFNSASVSGPETLFIPNLKNSGIPVEIVFLFEGRVATGSAAAVAYARENGFSATPILVSGKFDFAAIRELQRHFLDTLPTLVHSHGPKAGLYVELALRGVRGQLKLKHVTTHHGVSAYDRTLRLRFFEWLYEKFVIPKVDRCLTVCSSDRQILISRGIKSELLTVHVNGVDRKKFLGEERATKRKAIRSEWERVLGVKLSPVVCAIVARLSPEKDHLKCIRAVHEILAKKPQLDFQVIFFGSGPLESELKAEVARLELGKRVLFFGYRSGMGEELCAIDVLISLSHAEGLPINLVEAGWGACAVLSTTVDGVKDLVSDEKEGLVVQVADSVNEVAGKLERLIQDEALRTRLGANFQQKVERDFSRQKWLETLKAVYLDPGTD